MILYKLTIIVQGYSQKMITIKILILTIVFNLYSDCFYVSKRSIPTLFVNELLTFNISHNGGDLIEFRKSFSPDFADVNSNGTIFFTPKNQGSFQVIINCLNSISKINLLTLSYLVVVLNKRSQIQKSVWLLDYSDYFSRANERPFVVQAEFFQFHGRIMTNQNIRLKLKTKNQIGNVTWFYQNLPETMIGSKNTGLISGYNQKEGTFMFKCIALDSNFRLGQIYIFLKFTKPGFSLQSNGYSTYTEKDPITLAFIKQTKQNSDLLEKQVKELLNQKQELKSQRLQKIVNFRNLTLYKQQLTMDEQVISQQIVARSQMSNAHSNNMTSLRNDLKYQHLHVDELEKIFTQKQKNYETKLKQQENAKLMQNLLLNQSNQIKSDFGSVKKQITDLQNQIFILQSKVRENQAERGRQNISYITWQKQEVRSREILEIRKNIEFQYIIKKAQTDNKVRRSEDSVFLAQSNYDSSYSQYKRQSRRHIQNTIQSSYFKQKVQQAFKEYEKMNQTMNRFKLNYAIALGSVQTLKVAKEQLDRLSDYVLNNSLNDKTTTLTPSRMIERQVRNQVSQYPFTGCQNLGGYAWAGSGRIKFMGNNSLTLGSEENINFGKCTPLRTKLKTQFQLSPGQWIQFSGYYWEGAIQADSITVISQN